MRISSRMGWLAVEDLDWAIDFDDRLMPSGHEPAICFPGALAGVFGAEYAGFARGGVGSVAVAAAALRQVAREAGVSLPDDQLRMLLGHAAFESGWGRGDPSKNTLANTNNWGSVQATRPWVQAHLGKPGFGAVAHQDSDPRHRSASNPSGAFIGWYAVYPNQLEGARAFFATVRPALTSDIDQYAANLYKRGYYTGFSTDAQKEISSYAKNIRAAMPKSVPADTPEAVAEAAKFSVGPLAPWANRMTAKDKVDGKVKFPASAEEAEAAWAKSWSGPSAYGLDLVAKGLDFANVAASGGIVWLGDPPPGFSAGGAGLASYAPVVWSLSGAAVGALLLARSVAGAVVGGVIGAGVGYVLGGFARDLVGKLALGGGALPALPAGQTKALPQPVGLGEARIKAVQTKLNSLGLGPLAVDGKLGPLTQGAIEKFQKGRQGLMMTGVLDVATLAALGV